LMLNPIGAVLTQMREAVLDPNAPSAARAIGGATRLLIPGGIVVFLAVLGLWFFNREAPYISEKL
jgi:ABC-2 type transport system permease protein